MNSLLAAAVTFLLASNSVAFSPSFALPAAKPSLLALHVVNDRRGFLVASGMAAATLLSPTLPAFAEDVDYKSVASDIMDLVKKDPDKGPSKHSIPMHEIQYDCHLIFSNSHFCFLALVRLAWHSSGTYDKVTKTGGSGGGTIRFKEELAHGGNAGLGDTAVKWLEPIYAKYDGLSYADLYTLSGVAAIKAMNGPTIGWSSGRVDQPVEAVTPDGRLPNADSGPPLADKSDADHIRTIFNRMGFNDQEIVALSGAHALGRCHTTTRYVNSAETNITRRFFMNSNHVFHWQRV